MKFKVSFLIFSALFGPQSSTAQVPVDSSNRNANVYQKQGNLVSVRIMVGEPIRIFITGREEAKINLNDLSLSVRRNDPYPGQILTTDRQNNYYVILDPVNLTKPVNLEIRMKLKNETETMNFKIKNLNP